ncbi:hypothetical protein CAEBREN_23024 [Caenorhabditis brenneri]|uniref:Uncharacterized protein n=1 Tax=Caenorhabditis brenneri TaxID=135651 RepID=G0NIN2_CAEBE|nr:hypothetical protein CAEBREN_23024 [Caenorhabditis brenneri]
MDGNTSNRPLSYDSTKCILAKLSHQKRFEVSRRCPGIRAAERATPMKIKILEFGNHEVTIDGVNYKVTIHQDYPADIIPEKVKKANDEGGVSHDFDQYGMRDFTVDHFLTPGDVLLKKGDWDDKRAEKEEERLVQMELLKARMEATRAQRIQENPENPNLALIGEDVPENPYIFAIMYKKMDDKLFPIVCKRSNTPFPYKKYIKFVKTDGWNTTTEFLEYNKKLYEAYKYLLHQLFAGRSDRVHVDTLIIRRLDPIMVLRLPENVKFKIGRLIESGERAIGNRVETLKQFTY